MERRRCSVKYEGSVVMLAFPISALTVKECTKSREDDYSFEELDEDNVGEAWLKGRECVIDSARESVVLKRLKQRIVARDMIAVNEHFAAMQKAESPLLKEMLRWFGKEQRKLVRSGDYKRANLRSYFALKCCDVQVKKKIRKYMRCRSVYLMKTRQRKTLKNIAHSLRISIGTVTELWRKLRTTKGEVLVQLHTNIQKRLALNDFLLQYFSDLNVRSGALTKTSRQLYADARQICGDIHSFSFRYFFAAFKKFGFAHRSLRYEPKAYKLVHGWHLQNFFAVYLFFLFARDRFHVLFIDESSICPSNFKKRGWLNKGESSVVGSSIKYEKLLLLGAMSQSEVVALQILHSGMNKDVFANFIVRLARHQLQQIDQNKQLVLFVDNCPSHRQNALMNFCRANNIIVLFNLPRRSEFNPIEFLWEYLKRPLRKLVTYEGLGYQ